MVPAAENAASTPARASRRIVPRFGLRLLLLGALFVCPLLG
jgi:hypothetical protein